MTQEQLHTLAVEAGYPECANAWIAGHQAGQIELLEALEPFAKLADNLIGSGYTRSGQKLYGFNGTTITFDDLAKALNLRFKYKLIEPCTTKIN